MLISVISIYLTYRYHKLQSTGTAVFLTRTIIILYSRKYQQFVPPQYLREGVYIIVWISLLAFGEIFHTSQNETKCLKKISRWLPKIFTKTLINSLQNTPKYVLNKLKHVIKIIKESTENFRNMRIIIASLLPFTNHKINKLIQFKSC